MPWHAPCAKPDMIDGRADRDPRREEPFEQPVQDDAAESVEQAEPYFPPTDPVMGEGSLGETGGSGDEALAELVRRALAEDAATTDLELEVDVRDRIATLRGHVPELTDTDNALAVAGRVRGIEDVVDEIEVEAAAT